MMKPEGAMYCPRCEGTGVIPDPRFHGAEARKRRLKTGIPLREMARRMSLSAAYLSDLELGRRGWREELQHRYVKALRQSHD
jgi:predicted transcriptional regulator